MLSCHVCEKSSLPGDLRQRSVLFILDFNFVQLNPWVTKEKKSVTYVYQTDIVSFEVKKFEGMPLYQLQNIRQNSRVIAGHNLAPIKDQGMWHMPWQ